MEITVKSDGDLYLHDTGGGTRDIQVIISVDGTLPPRRQRIIVAHEALGSMLGFILNSEQLDEIAYKIVDALDQLEVNNGMAS